MAAEEPGPPIYLEEVLKEPQPISRVICTENVVDTLKIMTERLAQGYHDLLVLIGNQG